MIQITHTKREMSVSCLTSQEEFRHQRPKKSLLHLLCYPMDITL